MYHPVHTYVHFSHFLLLSNVVDQICRSYTAFRDNDNSRGIIGTVSSDNEGTFYTVTAVIQTMFVATHIFFFGMFLMQSQRNEFS
jgi:hypothetical protein